MENIIELVQVEADNIKKFATKEEIGKLDFENFNAATTHKCIYGQMTGNCYGPRANELIVKCATRVYKVTGCAGGISTNDLKHLNGTPYEIEKRYDNYHSPIEMFVYLKMFEESKIKSLIDYLQGKTEKLNLVN